MKYYESKVYGKVCEMAFGTDLRQLGMMTKPELDLLLEKSVFDEFQNILEIGCGAGQIAAYINKKTAASFTCIDVDEDAIAWAANNCKDNSGLSFRVLDVRSITEIGQKFSKILAIDSLYFVSNKKIDTFYKSLKATIENLYAHLISGGELVVFWSELPFFKPERKSPECTQLGLCLEELSYEYISFGLTEYEIVFWKKLKDALLLYEEDLINEDSKDLFDSQMDEADFFINEAEMGRMYRNMYLIKKGAS